MITNFEEITEKLTEKELEMIPYLVAGFKTHTKENPIKAPAIIKAFNTSMPQYKITEPRLRKCVNYIRSKSIIPLIATSKGYYVSNDRNELVSQIMSLRDRSSAIMKCVNGLEKFLIK